MAAATHLERKHRVLGTKALASLYGRFDYSESSTQRGAINISQKWIDENIVSCTLVKARKGKDVKTQCHRLAKGAFEAVYQAIADQGLSNLIHTWDGLWVPRHKVWKPSNSLSSHSWGIAVDMNAATNGFGNGISPENLALAKIFVEHGYDWGGFWRKEICDAMHYELVDPNAWETLTKDVKPELILAIKRGANQIQYIHLKTDEYTPGAFTVNTAEMVALLGGKWAGAVARKPVADVVKKLGWEIYDRGDRLADKAKPLYYLFVQQVP